MTALYAFMRCLENPTRKGDGLLGRRIALAFLCKFSEHLRFLGASFLCVLIYFAARRANDSPGVPLSPRLLIGFRWSSLIFFWAGYRFLARSNFGACRRHIRDRQRY